MRDTLMTSKKTTTESFDHEIEAIYRKRTQDLVLDLAEAEARTHNMRFVNNSIRRKLTIRLETFVRRNQTLYKIALKAKTVL